MSIFRFRAVETGGDPFKMVTKAETRISTKISEEEVANAVSRLLKEKEKDRKRKKSRKRARNNSKKFVNFGVFFFNRFYNISGQQYSTHKAL